MSEHKKGEKENSRFLKKLINNIKENLLKEETKMSYSGSKTTDKLKIITDAAQKILSENPEVTHRIKSISIRWMELPSAIVPDIDIQFHDISKTGINLQK